MCQSPAVAGTTENSQNGKGGVARARCDIKEIESLGPGADWREGEEVVRDDIRLPAWAARSMLGRRLGEKTQEEAGWEGDGVGWGWLGTWWLEVTEISTSLVTRQL